MCSETQALRASPTAFLGTINRKLDRKWSSQDQICWPLCNVSTAGRGFAGYATVLFPTTTTKLTFSLTENITDT